MRAKDVFGLWLFITYVQGTFFGMSESGEASKRLSNSYQSAIRLNGGTKKKENPVEQVTQKHQYGHKSRGKENLENQAVREGRRSQAPCKWTIVQDGHIVPKPKGQEPGGPSNLAYENPM
jgi:hypothetical protein